MKAQKTVSSILIGLGCIILTIGLVAFLLPRIDNYQLQLVLSSFQEPSDNWFVSQFNAGMNFSMENYLSLLLIGAAVMLLGIVLLMSVRNEEAARAYRQRHRVRHTTHDNPYARPRTEAAAARHPMEETENNPFARYVNTNTIPKATGRETAEPAQEAQPQPAPEKQPEPLQGENPFVMHAYQPAKTFQRKPFMPAEDDADEEEPLFPKPLPQHRSESREAPLNAIEDKAPLPEEKVVSQPAAVASTRPVIRSTFRTTTFDQPHEEIVPDTAPAAEEEPAPEMPAAPQPGSRIRSTMGRKR